MTAMRILKIDHINIRTPLFEETLRFYEDCLGMRRGPVGSVHGRPQNLWLYADGVPLIHVNGPTGDEVVAEIGVKSRLDHFALSCSGLAQWRAHLTAQGVAFREARLQGREVTQLNLLDPNGVKIELQFAEI